MYLNYIFKIQKNISEYDYQGVRTILTPGNDVRVRPELTGWSTVPGRPMETQREQVGQHLAGLYVERAPHVLDLNRKKKTHKHCNSDHKIITKCFTVCVYTCKNTNHLYIVHRYLYPKNCVQVLKVIT